MTMMPMPMMSNKCTHMQTTHHGLKKKTKITTTGTRYEHTTNKGITLK